MAKRSKSKTYRITGPISYKGTVIGPGEEIPAGLSQEQIARYISEGKVRETDPATGLNIEPKSTRYVELSTDQVKSFFAKPLPYIRQHLERTDFDLETLAKMHMQAQQMRAPQDVMQQINSAMEQKMVPT